jgi:hypothetical protein
MTVRACDISRERCHVAALPGVAVAPVPSGVEDIGAMQTEW